MNYLASLLLPAAVGLIAGISHGMVSHYADLPMALSEQLSQPFEASEPLGD